MLSQTPRRYAASLLAAGLLVATAACTDFLQVENPGAIEEPNITSPAYISLLVNGVVGEFQPAFTSVALYSAVFTDELASFHGFPENTDIDRREIGTANGTYAGSVYTPLQSARFMGDSVAGLLQGFLGDTVKRDVRLARTLDYAGYSYALLGEQMCEAPISLSRPYTPVELLGFSLDRFKSAIEVATAAKSYNAGISPSTAASRANVAAADSLLNLALVGAARVSLDLGQKPEAATYAARVPTTFGFYVYHSGNTVRENNPFFGAASNGGSAEWVGLTNTPFASVTGDPRIPHLATKEKMQQDSAVAPNSPLNFSTYTGTPTGADFTRESAVRFASGLEAQYILAEAQGPTPTNVSFINARRAIAGQLPLVAPGASDFLNALIEQRARDLYLANYRMGDLRRYKKLYNLDLWQKGAYVAPVAAPPTFGSQECWPIPNAELNANPNIPRP